MADIPTAAPPDTGEELRSVVAALTGLLELLNRTEVSAGRPHSPPTQPARPTIPPHLIPLGPDGRPLIRPDGSPARPGPVLPLAAQHLGGQQSYKPTRARNKDLELPENPEGESEGEEGNMVSKTLEMIREMPMEDKRHMLANMMLTVPMAAISMAAAGLPHLAIAPLATLIPGFVFAAFTDVGHGHESEAEDGMPAAISPQEIIAAVRQFVSSPRNRSIHLGAGARTVSYQPLIPSA